MALRCLELQIGNGAPLRQARAHFNCLHFVLFQHLLLLLISLALATSFLLPCSKPLTISAHPFALADPRGVLLILGFLLFFGFLFFLWAAVLLTFANAAELNAEPSNTHTRRHIRSRTHSGRCQHSPSSWHFASLGLAINKLVYGEACY